VICLRMEDDGAERCRRGLWAYKIHSDYGALQGRDQGHHDLPRQEVLTEA